MSAARWFQRTGVSPGLGNPPPGRRAATSLDQLDPRVQMVLDVLGGTPLEKVAARWNVEQSLLERWAGDFLAAGSAEITHRPDGDAALQRDRFLAAVAHEMRTPVTVAQGWAMVLAEGDVPEEEVPASFEKLSESLGRLSEHIRDVELGTAASLGRLRLELGRVTVEELCREVPGMPDPQRGGELVVRADRRLLARVLRDLWTVAGREPEPASVVVEGAEVDRWHEIRVVRTGHPLGHRVLQSLLDPFGSNDDATGVTTGLYMARALVVAHGGVIGAEGDEERTVLLVRLPREEEDSRTTGSRADDEEGGRP